MKKGSNRMFYVTNILTDKKDTMTAQEAAEKIGCSVNCVYSAAKLHTVIKRKWLVVPCEKSITEIEWDETIRKFQNVEWVKAGGRRLYAGKSRKEG